MARLSILFIVFFFQVTLANCQDSAYLVDLSAAFKHIIENRHREFGGINMGISNKIVPLSNNPQSKAIQSILVLDSSIFVTIDGSGWVYEFSGYKNENTAIFRRLDSSYYIGNNFNSLSFGYQNNIYNIGGYGFWRTNGQLRLFSRDSREWGIVPLSKEYEITNVTTRPTLWYDVLNGKINSIENAHLNQAIIEHDHKQSVIDSLYQLDLQSNKWTSLGALHSKFRDFRKNNMLIINTNFGLLVSDNTKIQLLLWDIKNNSVSRINEEILTKFPVSNFDEYIFWYMHPYVYFSKNNSNNIDSIKLSPQNFTNTGTPIYVSKKEVFSFNYFAYFFAIVIFLTFGYFIIRTRLKKSKSEKSEVPLKTPAPSNSIFTEIEKSLLRLLANNIRHQERLSSIDEVNYVLGISNKTLNMQKRTRSDVIGSINSKFQIYFKKDEQLILRRNSEFDQRVKEFYITTENISLLEKLI